MPSIAINIALVVALVFTCGFSFAMLREFRRFKAHAGEYGLALKEASRAMEAVDEALGRTHDEGAQTVISLGERLEAAERLLGKLKTAEAAATAQLMRLRDRIDEARDVIVETQSTISDAAEGFSTSMAAPKTSAGKKSGGKAVASTVRTAKTCSRNHAPGKVSGQTSDQAADQFSGETRSGVLEGAGTAPLLLTQHTGVSGTLALAPASATASQAPRTRKILSWPIIRSA
ncbi:MAG: hypothetical protein ACXIVE_05185 [Salinarimonas sp.]